MTVRTQLPPSGNPRRRRRRNQSEAWYHTRRGKIAIGAGAGAVAAGLVWIWYERNIKGKKPEITDATVIDQNGNVLVEPSKPNPAKPVAPAKLPAEILAGGVPLEAPWHTVGWYTYPEGQIWIRVDQYGDALFQEGETTLTEHTATINGRWRWIVLGPNAATWIATGEIPQQTHHISHNVLRSRYSEQSASDEMIDAAAKQAANWIDTAYGLNGAHA